MDYAQLDRDLDSHYRYLEEKYRHTMEEHLRAIEEKHCLEMKQNQLTGDQRSKSKRPQDRSKEGLDPRAQDIQEQDLILTDYYRQHRHSHSLAVEEQHKRQKQDRTLEEQGRRNKELGDRVLEERYRRYTKQEWDRTNDAQFKKDREDLHRIKEGLGQRDREVANWPRMEQLQYRVETLAQDPSPHLKGRGQPKARQTVTHSSEAYLQAQPGHNQQMNEQQVRGTEAQSPQCAEGHLGYYADDESSSESRTSESVPTRQSSLKMSLHTLSSGSTPRPGGAPNTPQSSINMIRSYGTTPQSSVNMIRSPSSTPRSSVKTSQSSVRSSTISDINQDVVKAESQTEQTNWLKSFIINQIPYIFNQLHSSDMPPISNEQHLKEFMAFLQEQNVLESLQNVAEKAVAKLTQKSSFREIGMAMIDTKTNYTGTLGLRSQSRNTGPRSTSSGIKDRSSISSDSDTSSSQSHSPTTSLDREVSKSSSSIERYDSNVEDQPPRGFWEETPLKDTILPQSRKEYLAPWQAKSPICQTDSDTTQKSHLSSSEKSAMTWESYHLPELLFLGSVSSTTDLPVEKSSSPASFATSSAKTDRMNTSSPESHLLSSSGRYMQFLDFLEEKKVFSALQDVVDKAIQLLVKSDGKEINLSKLLASDPGLMPESFQVIDPTEKVLEVTDGKIIEPPITQIYKAEIQPPGSGEQLPQAVGVKLMTSDSGVIPESCPISDPKREVLEVADEKIIEPPIIQVSKAEIQPPHSRLQLPETVAETLMPSEPGVMPESFPKSDPKSEILEVAGEKVIKQPIIQLYKAEIQPPGSGQQLPEADVVKLMASDHQVMPESFLISDPKSKVLEVTAGKIIEPPIIQIFKAEIQPQAAVVQPSQVPEPHNAHVPPEQPPSMTPQRAATPQIVNPVLRDIGSASTKSSQRSRFPTEPPRSTSVTSSFRSQTPSTTTGEMEQASTTKSLRTSSTVKTKYSLGSSSRATSSTSKSKPSTSKGRAMGRAKKTSDAPVNKNASKSQVLKKRSVNTQNKR
ncbi:serine-rich adhesin for platelets-like isoform X2 [Ambystoma mexicanum]|uniref:serine-rich adhesin for platelets-like isoform X2 n=1 Tax=Ambystoma mexicanum TaxID=8296 RepID=UPI0037E8E259